MKILVRNSDNLVVHSAEKIFLSEEMAFSDYWHSLEFNVSNATVFDVLTLPENYSGYVFSYVNGIWGVVNQSYIDEITNKKLNDKKQLVRTERNARLQESDWTQVSDSQVDKQAWATYRQALRDITQQTDFPESVIWPTQPE